MPYTRKLAEAQDSGHQAEVLEIYVYTIQVKAPKYTYCTVDGVWSGLIMYIRFTPQQPIISFLRATREHFQEIIIIIVSFLQIFSNFNVIVSNFSNISSKL